MQKPQREISPQGYEDGRAAHGNVVASYAQVKRKLAPQETHCSPVKTA